MRLRPRVIVVGMRLFPPGGARKERELFLPNPYAAGSSRILELRIDGEAEPPAQEPAVMTRGGIHLGVPVHRGSPKERY